MKRTSEHWKEKYYDTYSKNILSSLIGYVRLSLQQSKRGSRSPSGGSCLAALVNTQTHRQTRTTACDRLYY